MKKYYWILFIFLFLQSKIAFGQATDKIPVIQSPQVATLGQFGSYPVSLYTGNVDISIPIYNINLRGQSIPISLSYDCSGFLPNKESGIVGQNWTLYAGGVITRTVNGIPDEQSYVDTVNRTISQYGYWYGINEIEPPKSAEYIKGLSYARGSKAEVSVDLPYEHNPDLFTFNFCGHSGQFLIGNDGEVKVISDDFYTVDLSDFAYQRDDQIIQNSGIKITSKDGFEFYFGGALNMLEVELKKLPTSSVSSYPLDRGTISAWYLRMIKAPNRESVSFIYEEQDVHEFLSEVGYYPPKDRDYIEKICYNADYRKISSTAPPEVNDRTQMSYVKICYLKEIKFPLGSIKFNYSEKTHSFFGNHREYNWKTGDFIKNTKKLDSIVIKDKANRKKKDTTFSYDYLQSSISCYRMFLKEIAFNDDDQKYKFDYNTKSVLPDPLTSSIDLWGYYNGYINANSQYGLIPRIIGDPAREPIEVDFTSRKTNPIFNVLGLLSRITYPTGGYTNFHFETHDYSCVYRRTKKKLTPGYSKVQENGYAGGVRIRSIEHSTGEIINYSYKTTTGESSGILIEDGIYFLHENSSDALLWKISSNSIFATSSIREPHISYSRIIEKKGYGDFGYTIYNYSNHATHPDFYQTSESNPKIICYSRNNFPLDFRGQMASLVKYSSRARERGQLLLKETHNSSDQLVKEERFIYNDSLNRFQQAVHAFHIPVWGIWEGCYQSYAIYYYPTYLTKKYTYEYFGNNAILTDERYSYDTKYRVLKEAKIWNPRSEEIRTEYFYPFDTKSTLNDTLLLFHKYNSIVETREWKNSDLLVKRFNNYGKVDLYFYDLLSQDVQYGTGPRIREREFILDDKGNPLQVLENQTDTTCFIWSHNYQYPVAKIQNVSYNSLKKVYLSYSTVGQQNTPNMETINGLRSKLPEAFITTYTYNPLIGITQIVTPGSVTMNYNYDNAGRLIHIKDDSEKCLEEYKYHFKNPPIN